MTKESEGLTHLGEVLMSIQSWISILMAILILVAVGCSGGEQSSEQAAPPTATATPVLPVGIARAASLRDVLQMLPDHATEVTSVDLARLRACS